MVGSGHIFFHGVGRLVSEGFVSCTTALSLVLDPQRISFSSPHWPQVASTCTPLVWGVGKNMRAHRGPRRLSPQIPGWPCCLRSLSWKLLMFPLYKLPCSKRNKKCHRTSSRNRESQRTVLTPCSDEAAREELGFHVGACGVTAVAILTLAMAFTLYVSKSRFIFNLFLFFCLLPIGHLFFFSS